MDQTPAIPHTAPAPTTAPPPRHNALFRWIRDVLISIAAVLFMFTYLYQPVRVEGTSMLPGLQDQERLFINRFAYRFGPIERGDIVVFFYPRDVSKSYIKRVIALPGDHVRIDHGQVYVNNEPIDEPYVPARYRDEHSMRPIIVPPEEYFVLGDHRNIAADSREFGPVPRQLIYGKATLIYWPTNKFGAVK